MCMATDSDEVEKVALPLDSVPLAMLAPPSRNVAVPVGVPEPDIGVMVAVKVTLCPKTDGLSDDDTVVVVLVLPLTVCVMVADALLLKLASPP